MYSWTPQVDQPRSLVQGQLSVSVLHAEPIHQALSSRASGDPCCQWMNRTDTSLRLPPLKACQATNDVFRHSLDDFLFNLSWHSCPVPITWKPLNWLVIHNCPCVLSSKLQLGLLGIRLPCHLSSMFDRTGTQCTFRKRLKASGNLFSSAFEPHSIFPSTRDLTSRELCDVITVHE